MPNNRKRRKRSSQSRGYTGTACASWKRSYMGVGGDGEGKRQSVNDGKRSAALQTETEGGTEATKRRQVGALKMRSGRTSRPRCRNRGKLFVPTHDAERTASSVPLTMEYGRRRDTSKRHEASRPTTTGGSVKIRPGEGAQHGLSATMLGLLAVDDHQILPATASSPAPRRHLGVKTRSARLARAPLLPCTHVGRRHDS